MKWTTHLISDNVMTKTIPRNEPPSPLSCAIRALLDDSKLLSRKQWAELLGVTPSALSLWVNDRSLPSSIHLSEVWDFVRSSSSVPEEVLQQFRNVADLPVRKVTPLFERIRKEKTVSQYMLRPLRDAMLATLSTLPAHVQEEAMFEMSERCRSLSTENHCAGGRLVSIPWIFEPGTRVSEFPELSDLFKNHWKSITVLGRTPRDGSKGFFGRVAMNLLTRYTPHAFSMYYVIPSETSRSFVDEIRSRVGTLEPQEREIAWDRIRILDAPMKAIEEMLFRLSQDQAKAELVVVMDMGEDSECGYVWFANESGTVINPSDFNAIAKEALPYSLTNVIPFSRSVQSAIRDDLPPVSINLDCA
jgi:hypothetical protein